jgi:hypothetical protein
MMRAIFEALVLVADDETALGSFSEGGLRSSILVVRPHPLSLLLLHLCLLFSAKERDRRPFIPARR